MKSTMLPVSFLFGLIYTVFSTTALASVFQGHGQGSTESLARERALADLAHSIKVDIQSETINIADSRVGNHSKTTTRLKSDISLLGTEVSCFQLKGMYHCVASLNSATTTPLFVSRLRTLEQQITSEVDQLNPAMQEVYEASLIRILAWADQWQLYQDMLSIINPETLNTSSLKINIDTLQAQLKRSQSLSRSLKHAAFQLTQNITDDAIYVFPAKPLDSQFTSEFSERLALQIRPLLNNKLTSLPKARYYFQGNYVEDGDGLIVTYQLINHAGFIRQVNKVTIAPEVYDRYSLFPETLTKFSHLATADPNKLNVELMTNQGRKHLAFHKGDEIELTVRLNKPGYLYLIGETHTQEGEFSYLIPLTDGTGDHKFIQYVSSEHANQAIALGTYMASPPYGSETLKAIASEVSLTGALPSTRMIDGYNIIIDGTKPHSVDTAFGYSEDKLQYVTLP